MKLLKKLNERFIRKNLNQKIKFTANLGDQQVNQSTSYKLEIILSQNNTKSIGSNWLVNFKQNQNSEHGEDGIISKIFEILKPQNKWVCEFGAHDPEIISNTWRLINTENWNAVLIEGNPLFSEKLVNYYKNNPSVFCLNDLVSFEGEKTLDNILKTTPAPLDLDFMIIDIDGNDYHVWEAINNYCAKVVMIEFNATIPCDVSFIQPKDLNINQGNSLKAMTELASKKGYKLIAVTTWNAFFVKDQYYHLFFEREPTLEDMYVYPAKHPISMRPFQLYDGTIFIAPWNQMLWHKVDLTVNDCQVLPENMRVFSRELLEHNNYSNQLDNITIKNEKDEYLQKVYQMPGNKLTKFAKNIFSRDGEDGIIESLMPVLKSQTPFFVEVGAGDGMTNSRSRHLVNTHQWRGLQFETHKKSFRMLQKNCNFRDKIQLCNVSYALSGDKSLDNLMKAQSVPKELDVLILNDFGMEYYIWESIQNYFPKVVIVQFNPTIPNDVKFIQAKNFNIHQGCSLRALCELAHYKDYELVAVTLESAFFVRRQYMYPLFELYGISPVDIDEIFCPIAMKWFQLFDGTIVAKGLDKLWWHGVKIEEEKIQVIPKNLRKFHQFAEEEDKKFYRV